MWQRLDVAHKSKGVYDLTLKMNCFPTPVLSYKEGKIKSEFLSSS